MTDTWAEQKAREDEWRAALKAGDKVSIWDGWSHRLTKVERCTTTRIIVDRMEFRKDNGRRYGGSKWDRQHICPVTPEILEQKRRDSALQKVENIAWRKLPTDTLENVLALIAGAPNDGSHG